MSTEVGAFPVLGFLHGAPQKCNIAICKLDLIEVRFNFFTCASESKFEAHFIRTLKILNSQKRMRQHHFLPVILSEALSSLHQQSKHVALIFKAPCILYLWLQLYHLPFLLHCSLFWHQQINFPDCSSSSLSTSVLVALVLCT